MVFDPPIIPFLTELNTLFLKADEMSYEIYDSGISIQEIAGKLKNMDTVNFGVITDVSCVPESAKYDTILWRMQVRVELFSTYKGRKQIADMIRDVGTVATKYLDAFSKNLHHTGYKVVRMNITDTAIGSSNYDGALTWQNGYITLQYYLSQLD